MNGGDGPCSYAQNSSFQRGAFEAAKSIINMEMKKHLQFPKSKTLRIADFGCSSGPNTVLAMQFIVETIKQLQSSRKLELQVFFNDHMENDFKTLFERLPSKKQYHAAAVFGSFYSSLFPKSSLHFCYSSCALCWLSELPEEIMDRDSNKGRIHYNGAPKYVLEAYRRQYKKDMELFLAERAEELASEGLMALIVPGVPDVLLASQTTTATEFQLIGSCLMDMAKEEIIREEKVDTFNLPIYYTSPTELRRIIHQNEQYNIERMEILSSPNAHSAMPNNATRALYLRAVLEGLIEKHFGVGIADEVFVRYENKIGVSSFFLNPDDHKAIMIFVLLKRKSY